MGPFCRSPSKGPPPTPPSPRTKGTPLASCHCEASVRPQYSVVPDLFASDLELCKKVPRPFRHGDPDLSRLPDQRRCSPALAPRVLALRGVSGGATAHDPRPYVWAPGGTGGDVQERGGVLLVNVCGPIREDLGAMALGHSCVTVDGAELLDRGDEPHEPRRRGRALFFSDLARECAFGCSRSMRRERLGR